MSTKMIQGKLWSTAPQYWSKYFEPWFMPLYKRTVDELHLDEEIILLDAGCGAGMFSSLAIEKGAHVIGVDAAPGLLEVARRRNPQNNFLEEDLEDLPFADESFHFVVGFNSFQYAGSVVWLRRISGLSSKSSRIGGTAHNYAFLGLPF